MEDIGNEERFEEQMTDEYEEEPSEEEEGEGEGEQEQEVEDPKEVVDESSPKRNGDEISVRVGRDVLYCSECFDILLPPCYQCENGPVICSACWYMHKIYCHSSHNRANYSRSVAVEKIIQSIKLSCSNAKWGCGTTLCYAQMHDHKHTCMYAPSICPAPGCNFQSFTGWWPSHFLMEHRKYAKRFAYNQPFQLYFDRSEPFLALLGPDGHLFENCADTMGNCFSISCLRPGNLKWKFYYELTASGHECSILLKASVRNIMDWKEIDNNKDSFLLVPNDFMYYDVLPLDILIRRTPSYDV